MTDTTPGFAPEPAKKSLLVADARTRRRNAAETRFRAYGIIAIGLAIAALFWLLTTIFADGASAFRQTYATIPVTIESSVVDPKGNRNPEEMKKVLTLGYDKLLISGLKTYIAAENIQIEGLTDKDLKGFLSDQAKANLREAVLADPGLIGQVVTVPALTSSRIDGYFKGRVTAEQAARDSKTSPAQLALADALKSRGALETRFNPGFITNADASETRPEAAGLGVAILGSTYMMLIVLALALLANVASNT